jgi:hypothetical protein
LVNIENRSQQYGKYEETVGELSATYTCHACMFLKKFVFEERYCFGGNSHFITLIVTSLK